MQLGLFFRYANVVVRMKDLVLCLADVTHREHLRHFSLRSQYLSSSFASRDGKETGNEVAPSRKRTTEVECFRLIDYFKGNELKNS